MWSTWRTRTRSEASFQGPGSSSKICDAASHELGCLTPDTELFGGAASARVVFESWRDVVLGQLSVGSSYRALMQKLRMPSTTNTSLVQGLVWLSWQLPFPPEIVVTEGLSKMLWPRGCPHSPTRALCTSAEDARTLQQLALWLAKASFPKPFGYAARDLNILFIGVHLTSGMYWSLLMQPRQQVGSLVPMYRQQAPRVHARGGR